MFDQCLTANSNVSWSSSAWDCREAWEVVSLFVIRISLWHNFSRSSKKYKKAPLSTWNYLQGNSSSSRTQSSGSSWRPAAIGTPRLAQRTMSMWRGEGLQNVFFRKFIIPSTTFGEKWFFLGKSILRGVVLKNALLECSLFFITFGE